MPRDAQVFAAVRAHIHRVPDQGQTGEGSQKPHEAKHELPAQPPAAPTAGRAEVRLARRCLTATVQRATILSARRCVDPPPLSPAAGAAYLSLIRRSRLTR